MDGPLSGGVDTIQRPQLPPLPAATRAVRGIPDPFRGPAAGTQVEGLAPPAEAVTPPTEAAMPAVDTATAPIEAVTTAQTSSEIPRSELPPTPPALRPFAVARKSEAVAAQAAKKNSRVEALRNATPGNVLDGSSDATADETASGGSEATSLAEVPRPETPAAILALEEQKLTGRESKKAKKTKAKAGKKAGAGKVAKVDKTKGSGSTNQLRLVGALAALLILAGLAFFGSQFLGQGTSVSDLSAGECIEGFFQTDESGAFIEVSSLSTVDCAQPHAYEVFAVSDQLFPDVEYPGVDASFATGEDFCLNQYEEFIGGGRANLRTWEVWTFVPPEGSWDGDRRVQCVVGDINQEELVTGSLRGIAEG